MNAKATTPEVTVCILTYNQKEYISNAIEGALNQKDVSFNIVIADDCSNDGTTEICREYKAKYPKIITLIEQPVNKGIITNTQDCFMAATAPFIALCEGDDYWIDPYKLKQQVEVLNTHPDISLVHTNWVDLYVKSGKKEIHKTENHNLCNDDNLINNTIAIIQGQSKPIRFSTVCFRKNDLHKAVSKHALFDKKYSTVDVAFFLEFSQLGKFCYIDKATTVYRINAESVSITANPAKQIRFSVGVMRIYDYYMEIFNIPSTIRHQRLHRFFSEIYPYAFDNQDAQLVNELKAIEKRHKYPFTPLNFICKIGLRHKCLYPISKTILSATKRIKSKR